MSLYTNQTRHAAIVTVKINVIADPKAALKVGGQDVFDAFPGGKGYHDILVNPGMVLELNEGTDGDLMFVRSAG